MSIASGNRIKKARTAKGWTQQELAHRVGRSQPDICRIEKGRVPAKETAAQITRALGLPAKALTGARA